MWFQSIFEYHFRVSLYQKVGEIRGPSLTTTRKIAMISQFYVANTPNSYVVLYQPVFIVLDIFGHFSTVVLATNVVGGL